MKTRLKIGLLVFYSIIYIYSAAQTEWFLLPLTNKLLINPSYAGLHKDSGMSTGLRVQSASGTELDHTSFFTYDSYSEKLKCGFAVYFLQGLKGEENTNNTGVGLAYSKPINSLFNGKIIPSLNFNFLTGTKQWFVYSIDAMLNNNSEIPNQTANGFLRYNILLPCYGLLWDSPGYQAGFTFNQPLKKYHNKENDYLKKLPLQVTVHASKIIRGIKKGLISHPIITTPEIIVLYSEELLFLRTGIMAEGTAKKYGLFINNNFTGDHYGIEGLIGWKIKNVNLNISTGYSYSLISRKSVFYGEATVGLVIPGISINKDNPWTQPIIN